MYKYVAYYRVSTAKQGRSGLGLEAQQEAVRKFIGTGPRKLLKEFTEVETGKGSNALDKRPQLQAAKQLAKKQKATLLIAKLDRLARNVHFISGLMEDGVQFQCCDFPTADGFMLHIYAAVAEQEGRRISQRIKDALAAKKARGESVGNASSLQPLNGTRAAQAAKFAIKLRPTIEAYKAQKLTQREMVGAMNSAGIKTAQGGEWGLVQLQRVMQRLA
jgi:DNA invertase Pin-like site-specific DNA recombinase